MQYLVLRLGDTKIATQVVDKSLNPEWDTVERFPITSARTLNVVCWDKDRFGKDYMGEFDLSLGDIFRNRNCDQGATWYQLRSKRPGKVTGVVSGQVQLQLSLVDSLNPQATSQEIVAKFLHVIGGISAPVVRSGTICSNVDVERSLTPRASSEERGRGQARYGSRRKRHENPYSFIKTDFGLSGVIFLEVSRITDLPGWADTSFDMNPFVIASLSKQTYRTRHVHRDHNPVFDEKMLFQIGAREQRFSLVFTIANHDAFSERESIASCHLPIQDLIKDAAKPNQQTGLYDSEEADNPIDSGSTTVADTGSRTDLDSIPSGFRSYDIPLELRHSETSDTGRNPILHIQVKYMAYAALRQKFWRTMLHQYDADGSGMISMAEITIMLESLGSTLAEATIDSFFQRFPPPTMDNQDWEITMDQAVICLEDELKRKKGPSRSRDNSTPSSGADFLSVPATSGPFSLANSIHEPDDEIQPSDAGSSDEDDQEHVTEIKQCPICRQPSLNRRDDAAVITHVAICLSQDWSQVNEVITSGFATSSQAQRKWYSKVITNVTYGGYGVGSNSANILIQDRVTGQIEEEKMSPYVRLGIRFLYKGLKSRDLENKQVRKLLKNLSVKQGRKFEDPASKKEIEPFIEFHGLDLSEVLLPLDEFKNFNEFFYRALKPGSRPCSAPDNPHIVVCPADCRSIVFNSIDQATELWIKGRQFSVKKLLGDAYPEDVPRYEDGGAVGIFRLAPQDYHRFHFPVDGIMGKPKTIAGDYYTVNPMAIRSALDVYGENVRVLVPVDTELYGRVMIICVGAMMVGSTVISRFEGERVRRAEELGYFKFGGSTILLLFEPGKMRFDEDLTYNSKEPLETLVRVGTSIGHSVHQPPFGLDSRDETQEVSQLQKQDAKRQIQGSTTIPGSADGAEARMLRRRSTQPTVGVMAASAM
ncbi:phosphatidylserine decarboxylase [Fusarium pseudocircinatum]|uniref:Phosphatidylserine decarboxylase proenzyme 2 n=1 Tax=Fusarium pseudocircinatum TaxID=56676 RepID=A0A8H5LBW9_9HYPO|nr:phosphatidylserine decarboxylase [Fusarium pseudocircinatum]